MKWVRRRTKGRRWRIWSLSTLLRTSLPYTQISTNTFMHSVIEVVRSYEPHVLSVVLRRRKHQAATYCKGNYCVPTAKNTVSTTASDDFTPATLTMALVYGIQEMASDSIFRPSRQQQEQMMINTTTASVCTTAHHHRATQPHAARGSTAVDFRRMSVWRAKRSPPRDFITNRVRSNLSGLTELNLDSVSFMSIILQKICN